MIEWICGESGVGKSTLAKKLVAQTPNAVLLDGDDMRKVWPELTFSREDRRTQNIRVARLARILELQGFSVIVATICPSKKLRDEVRSITHCKFILIDSPEDEKSWS